MERYGNGQTGSCRALRGGDGSRHSRCRFAVLQKPILGTADSEYWHCLGVRSFLLEIPEASMNKARQRPFAAIVQTHLDRLYPPLSEDISGRATMQATPSAVPL